MYHIGLSRQMKGWVYRLTRLQDAKGEALRCVMMLNSLGHFRQCRQLVSSMVLQWGWGYTFEDQVNFEIVVHGCDQGIV